MTAQPAQQCIRGCQRRVMDPNGDRILEPRLATEGLLDAKCAGQIRDWAREIIELYALLDTRPGSTGSPFAPGKRHKVSGSPALARLDVVLLQDWRTTTKAKHHEPGDEHAQGASIPETFLDLANSIARDDLKITKRVNTLTEAIEFITGPWFTNICYLTWIDVLYETIKDTRQLLRRTNNLRDPRPLGKCGCGQTLYEPDPVRDTPKVDPHKIILECRNCGHKLDALSITRLAAAQRITR